MDNYLTTPINAIYLSKCYILQAEIAVANKEYDKCIEFSKRYISALTKFTHDHPKDFDVIYDMIKTDLQGIKEMEYKAYRLIAQSYFESNDQEKCRKYAEFAIERLNLIHSAGDSEVD
jgi:hypothetical protein